MNPWSDKRRADGRSCIPVTVTVRMGTSFHQAMLHRALTTTPQCRVTAMNGSHLPQTVAHGAEPPAWDGGQRLQEHRAGRDDIEEAERHVRDLEDLQLHCRHRQQAERGVTGDQRDVRAGDRNRRPEARAATRNARKHPHQRRVQPSIGRAKETGM